MKKRIRVLAGCWLALLPVCLPAQDDINAKSQALEQRIKALESEVSTLQAALAAAPEPQPPPAPTQPLASATGASQSSHASARLMNPASSLIAKTLGAAGPTPVDP